MTKTFSSKCQKDQFHGIAIIIIKRILRSKRSLLREICVGDGGDMWWRYGGEEICCCWWRGGGYMNSI